MQTDITLEQAGEVTLLTLQGNLTRPNALRLREALLNALAAGGHVGLEMKNVGEVDLTFVQLLCAAARRAAAEGKELTVLNRELPGSLLTLVRAAGFAAAGPCPVPCRCWIRREFLPEAPTTASSP